MKVENLKHPFILESIVAIFGKQFEIFLKKQQGILQQNILYKYFSQNGENSPQNKITEQKPPALFFATKKNHWPPPLFLSRSSEKCRPKNEYTGYFRRSKDRIRKSTLHTVGATPEH
jgi:hypothetical protein